MPLCKIFISARFTVSPDQFSLLSLRIYPVRRQPGSGQLAELFQNGGRNGAGCAVTVFFAGCFSLFFSLNRPVSSLAASENSGSRIGFIESDGGVNRGKVLPEFFDQSLIAGF